MRNLITWGGIAYLIGISPLLSVDFDLSRSKQQTAQAVTLARLGAILCPDLDADEEAVNSLMAKAGITDTELSDSNAFGAGDLIVTRSFAHSFMDDPRSSCVQIRRFRPRERTIVKASGQANLSESSHVTTL